MTRSADDEEPLTLFEAAPVHLASIPRILREDISEGRRRRAVPPPPKAVDRPKPRGPRDFGTGSPPPTRQEDPLLHAVRDELLRLDPTGARTAAVIRRSLDQIYDGRRTGRWDFTQLMKTEKTHVGTLVEIWMQREFEFDDGHELDFYIVGTDVDCKWSRNLYEWEIPLEMHVRGEKLGMLIWGNEDSGTWALGLLRIGDSVLRPEGRQRDRKRRLNDAGCDRILWVRVEGDMIRNTLVDHPDVAIAVSRARSGQEAVVLLFRRLQGVLVNQATVETAAQQIDSAKRVRDARKPLAKEGIVILGHYRPHPQIAADLGLPIPTLGRFVSARLSEWADGDPEPSATIAGNRWRLARPDDPVAPAPPLPAQGKPAEAR